jgi:hypothetical protein
VTVLTFSALVFVGAVVAGLLGSLTGLGGGVVIVPMLAVAFGLDLRYAVGASLVSVIATSSGAAAAYVREGYTNLRIGMFLELATTVGAILGAVLATVVHEGTISVVFGLVLVVSAWLSGRQRGGDLDIVADSPLARWLQLNGSYPSETGWQAYGVRNVPAGFGLMMVAGVISGLLGIGSGAFKVLAMDQVMRIPFKVSTATSNFMIGVTAAASAGIYLGRGYIDPGVAMPVMLGVLLGSMVGSRLLARMRTRSLRAIFGLVVVVLALEMIYKGLTGRF